MATASAVALPTVVPVAGAIPVPTARPFGGMPTGAVVGRLEGDAAVGCVWLVSVDDGHRIDIIWPYGFRAAFRPLRLFDASGTVVARRGDVLMMGGGLGGAPGRCAATDEVWYTPVLGENRGQDR